MRGRSGLGTAGGCTSQTGKGEQTQVWKIPSQGGDATQVTRVKEGAIFPQESPDGKFLYYSRGWPFAESVWKIPIDGGEETKVLDSVHPNALWTPRQEGIYYFTAPDAKGASDLCFLEFVSGKIRKILRTERDLADDWECRGFSRWPDDIV